jgi:hypothetical protein
MRRSGRPVVTVAELGIVATRLRNSPILPVGLDPSRQPVREDAEMAACAYCERPLNCDACRAEYQPVSEDEYRALSQPEEPILCRDCGSILVCHWCKEPYSGESDDELAGE